MNWLANQTRLHLSARGMDPIAVKESARKALPAAADVVNRAWRETLAEPEDKDLRARFLRAAAQHAALVDLADAGGDSTP